MKMDEQHPIEGLMVTAMNSIQDMIDVNTIIGEPIETSNNVIIIPISKVGFGFVAGGSEGLEALACPQKIIHKCDKNETQMLIDYIKSFNGKPITIKADGRITKEN